MPELSWQWGYPAVMTVTVCLCGLLYYRFKRSGWL
jgi:magnesium transporter